MRTKSFIWLSAIGDFFLIISFFLPYFSGAEDFGLPASAYSLGYWPHLLASESLPIFDGGSLTHRFLLLEVVGIFLSLLGIMLFLYNREKIFFVSNELLVIIGGVISISGVVLAINYALNTYKLGWVQILDVEIGIWLALVGSIFVIIGAIVCRTYNSTIGKFQRKPEPILFSKMPNGLAKQTQFQNSFLKSNKNRINNRESLSSNKYGCKHCGKTIPKTAIQCPHCFSKTN